MDMPDSTEMQRLADQLVAELAGKHEQSQVVHAAEALLGMRQMPRQPLSCQEWIALSDMLQDPFIQEILWRAAGECPTARKLITMMVRMEII